MIDRPVATVLSVHPNKIRVAIENLREFAGDDGSLRVGSYLRIADQDECALIGTIDNFTVEPITDVEDEPGGQRHIIEVIPLGLLDEKREFRRGGNSIRIPPTLVERARRDEIQDIFQQIDEKSRFTFARLAQDSEIAVPVDGDRFFNKHFALIGSTGSGKSHTVARILQSASTMKSGEYDGLNNAHIVILDLHGEYGRAFPDGNHLAVDQIKLPYWLMNSEELQELLLETGDNQAYNQASLLQRLITSNKLMRTGNPHVFYDTPCYFSVQEVLNALVNLNNETVSAKNRTATMLDPASGGETVFTDDEQKFRRYFKEELRFQETQAQKINKGSFNGDLTKFISRIRAKVFDQRLEFLFGDGGASPSLEEVLTQILGYVPANRANVTVVDLSGVPFEVLSITVSLISRLLFDFGYHLKRVSKPGDRKVPLLVVYEEAHRYVPRSDASDYKACRKSIERIAKEGRKYGVTLAIVSQRPSEISETIFSQCSNFIAMRLTNPDDQSYVRRLLPDSLAPLTESLPMLGAGEALLIGDAVVMPSWVKIDRCIHEPHSEDVPYLQEWKRPWYDVEFLQVADRWARRARRSETTS
ncbi:ATP-binding protein [Sorangium sp. So ce1182]|uniref:ATP-binding protein n=1 Tax=Sorangium sp. So ce1182 TaxID=3133334 RepID=UPI003F62C667